MPDGIEGGITDQLQQCVFEFVYHIIHKKTGENICRIIAAKRGIFLKGSITPADSNLAFVLINDRYNSSGRKTIVSTELTAAQLLAADEATGGRLLGMARGYVIEAPAQNWSLTPA